MNRPVWQITVGLLLTQITIAAVLWVTLSARISQSREDQQKLLAAVSKSKSRGGSGIMEAQEFRLTSNRGGKVLARLFAGDMGMSPTLRLFGDDGETRIDLVAAGGGGRACFYDEAKTKRISLMVLPVDMATGLWVSDSKGKDRAGVFVDTAPVIFTADAGQNPIWAAPPLRVVVASHKTVIVGPPVESRPPASSSVAPDSRTPTVGE